MLSQVVELIEEKRKFAITSHFRPDGDSLGSSLGLYWLLRALNKDVEVIMRDPVPHAYQQLPGAKDVRVTPAVDGSYHAVFVMECSDMSRPGLIDLDKQFVVNIDHHSTTALFGKINWIDSTASAVGEMIYNLCKATGVRVTKEIAECCYTALITDTGSFHYSNTTERTFKVASELLRTGVKPAKTAEAVFASYPWSRIQLMGAVLSRAGTSPLHTRHADRIIDKIKELEPQLNEPSFGREWFEQNGRPYPATAAFEWVMQHCDLCLIETTTRVGFPMVQWTR